MGQVPISLNFIYVSKVISWATYVRFRRIIYHFEAYDEANQIQNHVLYKICRFMCDRQWDRCLLHINAVRLCETCTCPTCLHLSHLHVSLVLNFVFCPIFLYFQWFFFISQLKLSTLTNHIVLWMKNNNICNKTHFNYELSG